jgi:hypothetical protein
VKPSSELSFLYGNNVLKAGLGRITENTAQYQGVVVYSMADVPLGFGVTAKSTQECRKLPATDVVVFHQADVGEYLREEDSNFTGVSTGGTDTSGENELIRAKGKKKKDKTWGVGKDAARSGKGGKGMGGSGSGVSRGGEDGGEIRAVGGKAKRESESSAKSNKKMALPRRQK